MQAINSPNTGVHRPWICRNHFDEEDYLTSIKGVKTLDRRAVPHPTNRNPVTTQEADRDKEKPNVDRKTRARGPEAGGTGDQENTEIPSFSELVQDTLNKDVVESPKRKATEEAVKPKKKKKK